MTGDIELFLSSIRIDRGASDNTIQSYRRHLEAFSRIVGEKPIEAVTRADVQCFAQELSRSGLKASSANGKLSAVRSFFQFLCMELGLPSNPASGVEGPKIPKRLPKFLTDEETGKLLALVDRGLPYDRGRDRPLASVARARDRAMVYLLYATGIRVSELIGLKLSDIENGSCKVFGKGSKERLVPIMPAAMERIEAYLQLRGDLSPKTEHVFLSLDEGEALSRQAIWVRLKALAREAGVPPGKVFPHIVRHTCATHLIQGGMGIRSVQVLLGHSSLETTAVYAHVTPAHLKAAHAQFHPRGAELFG